MLDGGVRQEAVLDTFHPTEYTAIKSQGLLMSLNHTRWQVNVRELFVLLRSRRREKYIESGSL